MDSCFLMTPQLSKHSNQWCHLLWMGFLLAKFEMQTWTLKASQNLQLWPQTAKGGHKDRPQLTPTLKLDRFKTLTHFNETEVNMAADELWTLCRLSADRKRWKTSPSSKRWKRALMYGCSISVSVCDIHRPSPRLCTLTHSSLGVNILITTSWITLLLPPPFTVPSFTDKMEVLVNAGIKFIPDHATSPQPSTFCNTNWWPADNRENERAALSRPGWWDR